MKLRFFVSILLVLSVALTGLSTNLKAEIDRRRDLAAASDRVDSLEILVDIFDAAPLTRRGDVAKVLYPLAESLERTDLQLDILTQLASAYAANDSAMALIVQETERIPESELQREMLTYVKVIKHVRHQGGYENTDSHHEDMVRLTRRLNEPMPDNLEGINERVNDMFTVISYLQRSSPGVLLEDILVKLDHTMRKLPLKTLLLKQAYFNQSAAAYTLMGKHDKALKADSLYLDVVDQLERQAVEWGRRYCSYDRFRYMAYRRMLYNYRGTPLEHIRKIYRALNDISLREPDVAADIERNGRAKIHYYVAERDWAKAIPLIKQHIDDPENQWTRRAMLRYLIRGSIAVGDHATELSAMREYIKVLEEYLASRYDERIRELQIVYGINDLSERNVQLEKERKETIERNQRVWVVVAATVIPLLLVLIVGLFVLYRRSRRLTADLEKSVSELQDERDNVLRTQKELIAARDRAQVASRHKTDFINNMTHEIRTPLNAIADYSRLIADCVDDSKRPYLDHYAKLIDLNNELVQTMVNDVLDISEIDNSRLKINISPVNVNPLCTMAVESARHYLRPEVSMEFVNPQGAGITVHTDPRRVEQVLINLLNNAAKFTREGFVRLSYHIEGDKLLFAVTDSGIGIPSGKEEIIFQRFEKLDNSTQGAGLGLSIARLVAGMLKGTVTLDTSYNQGARFIFTIPLQ